jgi:hypothetical protein
VPDRWELVELSSPDGQPTGGTGVHDHLVTAVRVELLRKLGSYVDPADPLDVDQAWTEFGPDAMEYSGDLLFLLPGELADATALQALRRL